MRNAELRQRPQDEGTHKQQVDDGRDQRQQELEKKNIGQRHPTKRAVTRAAQRDAVLPERLQRAEGPAETLANQSLGGFGGLGPSNRVFIVNDAPTVTAYGYGQVAILGYGVGRESTGAANGF